jgi:hypothetical protein
MPFLSQDDPADQAANATTDNYKVKVQIN